MTYYKLNGGSNQTSSYLRLSGTSMAAPMVSGAAALLLQQQPALTPDQVKARLMRTATKNFASTSIATDPITGVTYTSTYDLFTVGAGYLDVWAALTDRTTVSGSALSPRAVYDSASGNTSVVFTPGSTWQDGTTWGTTVVWGTNVIVNGNCVVWGTAVVWERATRTGSLSSGEQRWFGGRASLSRKPRTSQAIGSRWAGPDRDERGRRVYVHTG